MIQIKNRRDIITAIYDNLERLVNCKLIAESEKIRNDIHTLVHVFYMAVEPAEKGRGEDAAEKRLKHLLQSETVQRFDELDVKTGKYKREMKELDEEMRELREYRAVSKWLNENAELYRKGRCDEWQRKENG